MSSRAEHSESLKSSNRRTELLFLAAYWQRRRSLDARIRVDHIRVKRPITTSLYVN
jgi:hypothetical protein